MSEDLVSASNFAYHAGSIATKSEIVKHMALSRGVRKFTIDDLQPGCAYKVDIVANANYGQKTCLSEPTHTKFATLKTVKMASKNTRASMLAEIVNLWRTEAKKEEEEHEKQLRKN